MSKKIACSAVLALVGLSATTYAMPPRPETCPAVANIQAAGLSYSTIGTKGYTVAQLNNYSTANTWVFGFTSIKANSTEDALKIGAELLSTLYGTPKPEPIVAYNLWACFYQTIQGNYGLAITPVNATGNLTQSLNAVIR